MSDERNRGACKMSCAACRRFLQAYQDDGLPKADSMQIFLHLRACPECAQELDRHKRMVALLETLPHRDPPAGFDDRILAAVPYDAYRAMANLRRPRVPAFLAEESVPGWIRSRAVRWTGASLAALALAGHGAGFWPFETIAVALAGLIPEVLLRLQGLGRRMVLAAGDARRGG